MAVDDELRDLYRARRIREEESRKRVRRTVFIVALLFIVAAGAVYLLRPGPVRLVSVTFKARTGLKTVEAGGTYFLSPADSLKVAAVKTEPELFFEPRVYAADKRQHDLRKGIGKLGDLWPNESFIEPKRLDVVVARRDRTIGGVTVAVGLSPLFWVEKGYRADTYEKGILYLERALALAPENPIIAYRLALRYNIVGDYKKAVSLLETFLPENPSIPFARLKIEAEKGLGNLDRVAEAYRLILTLDPDAEEEAKSFGSYLASNLGIDGAIERLKEEMKRLPEKSSALLLSPIANLYAHKGWLKTATKFYHKALDAGLDSPLIYYNLSNIYSRRKMHAEARKYMDMYLGKRPSDSDALLTKAQMELKGGDRGAAIRLLEKVVSQNKSNLDARLLLAELYEKSGQNGKARAQYEEIVKLRPNSHTAHFNLGTYHLEKKDYKKAKDAFQKAVELKPEVPETLKGLVAACEGIEDWAGALKPLETLWRLQPDDNYLKKLFVYYDRAKKYKGMTKTFYSFIEKEPKNPRIREYLAYSYLKRNKLKEALEQYNIALKLDPKNKDYLFKAARIEEKRGNLDGALAFYKKILDIDPDNEKAAQRYLTLSRKKILE